MSFADLPKGTDLLTQRGEIFRSKLIADFHLLESISSGGERMEVPRFFTHDIMEQQKMVKTMLHRPNGLVRFQVYSNKEEKRLAVGDRRKNRVINKNTSYPPLDLWASWIVRSWWFQNSILALILINSVVLGIQAELSDNKNPNLDIFRFILDIFDYLALLVFVVEILLKWIDNFWEFWENRWNIFDFFVTFLSFVPEIIKYSSSGKAGQATSDLTVVAENMRTFRVLRSLKMVSRFQKVRLIVLAVTKAFQAMVFITVLLFIFAFIFAIIGVIFFDYSKYSEQLTYKNSFSSFVNALITLFQLFTLDHWLDVYNDVTIVAGQAVAAMYVILWIIIGSFIFRNIFVGIMVNNFQSIRNDLFEEVVEMKERERRDIQMAEFANELQVRHLDPRRSTGEVDGVSQSIMSAQIDHEGDDGVKLHPTDSRFKSLHELKEAYSQHVHNVEKDSAEWQKIVEENLENLAKEEATFCWPRDSLFRYFLMMESMQENLKERQELMTLATEAMLHVQDT